MIRLGIAGVSRKFHGRPMWMWKDCFILYSLKSLDESVLGFPNSFLELYSYKVSAIFHQNIQKHKLFLVTGIFLITPHPCSYCPHWDMFVAAGTTLYSALLLHQLKMCHKNLSPDVPNNPHCAQPELCNWYTRPALWIPSIIPCQNM